jgi:hypothetical protein
MGRKTIDAAFETHATNEERLLDALPASNRRRLDASLRDLLAAFEG